MKVGTAVSSSASLLSGVPQRSILGHLLFLIFVNDLPKLVPKVSLYADVTAVIDAATSLATLENSMQSKINTVVAWMRKWRLRPNVKKIIIIMFVTEPVLLDAAQNITLTFQDGGGPIKTVSHHKHLGVVVDCMIKRITTLTIYANVQIQIWASLDRIADT